jgi:hypothetical protein
MSVTWTVAYRLRRANRFLRIDGVALHWDEATELALEVSEALGSRYEVYYVPTLASESEQVFEDRGNILVDSGRRVKIKEGGVLPEGVVAPKVVVTPDSATTMIDTGIKRTRKDEALRNGTSNDPTVEIVLPARFAEFIAGTNLIQNPETDGDPYTDEVIAAWTTAGVRRGQTVLTLPADARGVNVLNWLYEYAYTISFGAGWFDRGEKNAATEVRNRVSNAKYAIYKVTH